jgi:hypothetical protein
MRREHTKEKWTQTKPAFAKTGALTAEIEKPTDENINRLFFSRTNSLKLKA